MKKLNFFRTFAISMAMLIGATCSFAQINKEQWNEIRWSNGYETLMSHVLGPQKILIEGAGYLDAGYGSLYTVQKKANGNFTLNCIAPGNTKVPQDLQYIGLNEPTEGYTMTRQFIEDRDLLVRRDPQGRICDIYTALEIAENMGERRMHCLRLILCGATHSGPVQYHTAKGAKYEFIPDGTCTMEGKKLTYQIGVEENMPMQVIELSDGRAYFFELTPAGIDLYNTVPDPYIEGAHKKTTLYRSLIASKGEPRWIFLSGMVLDNTFTDINPPALRIMRNEIYARRGYVFSSPDLDKYFRACQWYKPLNDNSKVELNDVEKLNIEFLKAIESQN